MEVKQLQQLAEDLVELNIQVNNFIENAAVTLKDLQVQKHKIANHLVNITRQLPSVQGETPAPTPEQPLTPPAQD